MSFIYSEKCTKSSRDRGGSSGLSTDSGMTDVQSSDTTAMLHLCTSPPDSAFSMQRFMSSALPTPGNETVKWFGMKHQSMGVCTSNPVERYLESMSTREEDNDYQNRLTNSTNSAVESGPSEESPMVNMLDSNYKANESHREINDSDNNSMSNSYKFKNDITFRFCNAKKDNVLLLTTSDTSSTDSREDEKTSRAFSSSTSQYPTSEYSSNGNSSNGTSSCGSTNSRSPSAIDRKRGTKDSLPLQIDMLESISTTPGFALHPSGVYYIPVTIQGLACSSKSSVDTEKAGRRCHPVSILVNLAEPVSTRHVNPYYGDSLGMQRKYGSANHRERRYKRKDKSLMH